MKDFETTQAEGGLPQVAGAQLFASLSGFLFWIMLALLLHPLAYGEVAWKVSLAMLLSGLSLLGVGKTALAYYAKKGEGLLRGCLLLGLLSSLLTGALVFLLVDRWTGFLLFCLSLFSLSFHFELSRRSYHRYLLLWVGARGLTLLLPFLLYFLLGEVRGLLLGLSLSYLLFCLPLLGTSRGKVILPPLPFTLNVWLADAGAASLNLLDKVLIGSFFGSEDLAMYQFGNRFFLLFAVLPQLLFFYLLPERAAGRSTRRVERGALMFSLLLLLPLLLLSFSLHSLFPEFGEGARALLVMGLALSPATLSQIESSRLYAGGKSSAVLSSYLSSLALGLTGIILLGKKFGVMGMASGFLLSQVALALSLFSLTKLGEENRKLATGLLAVGSLTVLLLSSLSVQPLTLHVRGKLVVGEGTAMDTFVEIKVIDENKTKAKEAVRRAYEEIKVVEDLMSAEKRAELHLLNQTGTLELSEETLFVLRSSLEYSELSGGAFDVTVKPLTDLWMKEVKKTGKLPSQERLQEVLRKVGWEKLEVKNGKARFLENGMGITLGAIAKGYAVDKACWILKKAGVEAGLVNVGGDIRGFGKNWRIGIQHPRKEEVMLELELENFSIATSGDYRRFFLLGSRRVHHIVDPRTGEPAMECMSVTVIAENCLDADALSTTLFVLGPERGKELADELYSSGKMVKAMLVSSDGRILYSESWDLPRVEQLP